MRPCSMTFNTAILQFLYLLISLSLSYTFQFKFSLFPHYISLEPKPFFLFSVKNWSCKRKSKTWLKIAFSCELFTPIPFCSPICSPWLSSYVTYCCLLEFCCCFDSTSNTRKLLPLSMPCYRYTFCFCCFPTSKTTSYIHCQHVQHYTLYINTVKPVDLRLIWFLLFLFSRWHCILYVFRLESDEQHKLFASCIIQ